MRSIGSMKHGFAVQLAAVLYQADGTPDPRDTWYVPGVPFAKPELVREIAPVVSGEGRMEDATDRGWGVVVDTIEALRSLSPGPGELVSEAVAPGAVQITNDGQPIVLGKDLVPMPVQ